MAKVWWEVATLKLGKVRYTEDTDLQDVSERVDTAITSKFSEEEFARFDDSIKSEVQTIKTNYYDGVTFSDSEAASELETILNDIITNGVTCDDADYPGEPWTIIYGSETAPMFASDD